jgi:selenocysteine-specific translation elongation factor
MTVFRTSAKTGEGIDEFVAHLAENIEKKKRPLH